MNYFTLCSSCPLTALHGCQLASSFVTSKYWSLGVGRRGDAATWGSTGESPILESAGREGIGGDGRVVDRRGGEGKRGEERGREGRGGEGKGGERRGRKGEE